jgi:hypothetical protein
MIRQILLRSAAAVLLSSLAAVLAPAVSQAGAQGLQWRLEQPVPPEQPAGVQGSQTPIGLGRIGDIEFWAPNRGALITAGNGSTVPPGVWIYNGVTWREYASVCGATDGRIAWAGAEEFWTVSDGRPGQAANGLGLLPPLEDNTLCHFAGGSVVGSYAQPGFRSSSYMAMHGAACVSPSDCWFAGDPLPSPQVGAFHLHWNGTAVEPEPNTRAETIGDMRAFGPHLYESIALSLKESAEAVEAVEIEHPYVLTEIATSGSGLTFKIQHQLSLREQILPQYASGSFPQALGAMRLSADGESLWAAAGALQSPPEGSGPGALTVLRDSGGVWSQVIGPATEESLKTVPANLAGDAVGGIAAEPESSTAWLALDTPTDLKNPNPTVPATLAHLEADGTLASEELPSAQETAHGIGPKGAAYKLACPAHNDCWMATTQGWLYHLSEEGSLTLAPDTAAAFNGPLISSRPTDEGLPQVPSDAPPVDDSGLEGSQSGASSAVKPPPANPFASVTVPLLTQVHTRLVHGTKLELSFHLAVKARVKLVAMRKASVVASTPTRVLKAGKRSLLLQLNARRWPTKLNLQTHALAPLPKISTRSSNVESVGTSLRFPGARGLFGSGPSL